MQYLHLGKSGLEVSALGLGTNAFGSRADEETSIKIIDYAIGHGINFIDTANIYSQNESERIIGKALHGRRENVVLTTKAGLQAGNGPHEKGSSRIHLMRELENSLKRLQTDYLDLYQIHTFDPHTPLEETLRTLDDMVGSGKVRYIGASNYAAWELMQALGISEQLHSERYISIQVSYSLADRGIEQEMVPLCLDQGIGIIPYFPLAGGILSGKYQSSAAIPEGSRADKNPDFKKRLDEARLALGRDVSVLANQLNVNPSALALAWLMHRPAVSTIIAGATSVEQISDNIGSATLSLDTNTLHLLDEMSHKFQYGEPFATYRLE